MNKKIKIGIITNVRQIIMKISNGINHNSIDIENELFSNIIYDEMKAEVSQNLVERMILV